MSVAAGNKCVEMVAEICQQLGYSVWLPEKETLTPCDMKVNGLVVQVKDRQSHKERPNRVRLKTHFGSGTVAYMSQDFDAIVIRWFSQWYVIPSHAISRHGGEIKNGIHMPSVAEWMDRWDVLDGQRVVYAQQKCFDF
jgi:hypothetical protein